MSGITTTSILLPAIEADYSEKLLRARTRSLIHMLPLEKKILGKNKGSKLRFRRRVPFDIDTTPLGNSGATPPAKLLTAITIDAEPQWYGIHTVINEQVVLTGQDPALNMAAEGLGQYMMETNDQIVMKILASTASLQDCTGGANGDVPTDLSDADFSKAYQTLRSNDAWPCIMGREGSDKVGTNPIREAYYALCHSDLISDLDNLDTFTEKIRYPNMQGVRHSEHGSINGFAVHTSSLGSIDPGLSVNAHAIYNVLCMGRDAAASVSLEGNGKFLLNSPLDPLRQNFTAAAKWTQVGKILNDSYMLRVRCTLSI